MSTFPPPTLEYLCSYTATLAPPEIIGPVAEGIRVNFYVTNGQLEGPGMKGRLRPVGGDWLTIRPDGVGVLDVRATIELDDGAVLDVAYTGVGDLGAGGYERFLRGEMPATLALRTSPRLRTAHASHQWLQRELLVAVGEAVFETLTVRYDVYVVRP